MIELLMLVLQKFKLWLILFAVTLTRLLFEFYKWFRLIYLLIFCSKFLEKKRRIYDQYGKEGLLGHSENNNNFYSQSRRHQHEQDFIYGGFPFVFRDPEEVFREFFGGSPFGNMDDMFNRELIKANINRAWLILFVSFCFSWS